MDPNEVLEDLRANVKNVLRTLDESGTVNESDAEDLAVALQTLDEWITNGGFLPQAWQR